MKVTIQKSGRRYTGYFEYTPQGGETRKFGLPYYDTNNPDTDTKQKILAKMKEFAISEIAEIEKNTKAAFWNDGQEIEVPEE